MHAACVALFCSTKCRAKLQLNRWVLFGFSIKFKKQFLRVNERSSDSFIGRDDFFRFQEKS